MVPGDRDVEAADERLLHLFPIRLRGRSGRPLRDDDPVGEQDEAGADAPHGLLGRHELPEDVVRFAFTDSV